MFLNDLSIKRNTKRATALLLSCLLLTGCAQQSGEEKPKKGGLTSADIELIDPVSAAVGSEIVTYRNIITYDKVPGVIYPDITEYSFPEEVVFNEFYCYPGEHITAGQLLAQADNEKLKDQIKSAQESLADMDRSYRDDMEVYTVKASNLQENINQYSDEMLEDDNFAIACQRLLFQLDRVNMDIANRNALYDLDRRHAVSQLSRMKEKDVTNYIKADAEGTLGAIAQITNGSGVRKEKSVLAVVNDSSKNFICVYKNSQEMSKVVRLYLCVGGKFYDVEYTPYTLDEYNKIVSAGETVHSTFKILGDSSDIPMGAAGYLIMVKSEARNALSVSSDSIHRDELGYFVNVLENGRTSKAYVTKGVSDGTYTEITEGLEYGQEVQLSNYFSYGSKVVELERGDFDVPYTSLGYVSYPKATSVTADLDYGTVTLVEMVAKEMSSVKKGDLLARISVSGDTIDLEEKQLKLRRLREALEDVQKDIDYQIAISGQNTETYQRLINTKESYETQISRLTETISDMRTCFSKTELLAPCDGLVTKVTSLSDGAVLQPGESLMTLLDESIAYLRLPNPNGTLQYGNEITVRWKDADGNEREVIGTVVTLGSTGMTSSMAQENAYAKLPDDAMQEIIETLRSAKPRGYMETGVNIEAHLDRQENVVLVPVKAVNTVTTVQGGTQTYVTLVDENGIHTVTSFIAGWKDNDYYWVIEGLEEGQSVCLE